MAVLLLQNGIDTNIKNHRDQLGNSVRHCVFALEIYFNCKFTTAVDLARDAQTLQVLSVKSVRKVHKTVVRMEGPLLKRSRFLGLCSNEDSLERNTAHCKFH